MIARPYHVDPRSAAYPGSELAIQTLLLSRAHIQCPSVTFAAVPNAGLRGQQAARRALREGMRKGFEDLIATWPGRGIAFLEMKDRQGDITTDQDEWLRRHTAQGFPAGVFRHPDTALQWLREQGAPFITGARPIGEIVEPIVSDLLQRLEIVP